MKLSQAGYELIKKFEGFRSSPYKCSAGVPTIGYGSTFYLDGKKVTMNDKPITQSTAFALLVNVVEKNFELGVTKLAANKVRLTQNQFDALVSFAYNLGLANLEKSTLLKKVLVNPNDPTIRAEFNKWVNANGKPLQGLINRRKEEADLYFKK